MQYVMLIFTYWRYALCAVAAAAALYVQSMYYGLQIDERDFMIADIQRADAEDAAGANKRALDAVKALADNSMAAMAKATQEAAMRAEESNTAKRKIANEKIRTDCANSPAIGTALDRLRGANAGR